MKNLMHMLAAMAPLLFVPQQVEAASAIKAVIVIAMENTDADQIYDNTNTALAPYIHGTLMPIAARASNFNDPLPVKTRSEPHYIWMEAGTNSFTDHTFTDDDDPVPKKVKNSTKKGKNSAKKVKNSTASKDHLVTQLDQAGLTWMSYQEDMTAGQCPIESVGRYAAKHNPFVFFEDVSGKPPGTNNEFCIKHHKPYKDFFAADLAANNLANYVFITPNLCNDMHQSCKQNVHRITAGNDWLEAELPRIIDWVTKNAGVIFIIWDEGDKTQKLPFLAIGPGVNPNHVSAVPFNHGSLVRSVEEIFSLPILPKVSKNKTFADLFKPGSFP
jgi:phosphatidylinositol-3-phosphatase